MLERREVLADLNSRVTETSLGSRLTLSCMQQMLNFTTSLTASFFDTKFMFGSDCPQHPCVARWSPHLVDCGHIARARLTTSVTLDTRDDDLIPAQGVYCSASHILSSNMVGSNIANTVSTKGYYN